MSEAAARTILTLRTLDIAHFEAETRSFSGVSSKLGHLKKFGSHTRPKLCNWDSLPPKQLFLGLLFGFKHFFHLVRPNLPPPMIYIVGKLWIWALIWHRAIEIWRILLAVRILVTRPDCFVRMIWFLVLMLYFIFSTYNMRHSLLWTMRRSSPLSVTNCW